MNALTNLKKKEELVQFQKIKFQFRNDLFSMNYVNDLTKLFEADWESNGYRNVDESPYFQDVIKVFFCLFQSSDILTRPQKISPSSTYDFTLQLNKYQTDLYLLELSHQMTNVCLLISDFLPIFDCSCMLGT